MLYNFQVLPRRVDLFPAHCLKTLCFGFRLSVLPICRQAETGLRMIQHGYSVCYVLPTAWFQNSDKDPSWCFSDLPPRLSLVHDMLCASWHLLPRACFTTTWVPDHLSITSFLSVETDLASSALLFLWPWTWDLFQCVYCFSQNHATHELDTSSLGPLFEVSSVMTLMERLWVTQCSENYLSGLHWGV